MRRVLVPLDLPPVLRVSARPDAEVHTLGGETMGTTWSVKLVGPAGRPLQPVRDAIERVLAAIVAQMSTWAAESDISRFNRASPGTWRDLPAAFHEVLQYALTVASDTGGCYDPTVGALVDLWGFGPAGRRSVIPDDVSIAAARGDWRRVELASGCRALQPGGVRLDLSSVAKGYAVDRVTDELARLGFSDHLVEIGGELRGSGTKPDGAPWWVALERPDMQDSRAVPQTVVALHGLAVATSGDAQRHFEHGGHRLSHTIDPRSGYPASGRVASVTVLHRRCMNADALATALTVLGADDGFDFALRRGLAARFVLRGAGGLEERVTPALTAMLD
jgi:thiamine biosynthesis lipoprotein